jgi:hypothetical protein
MAAGNFSDSLGAVVNDAPKNNQMGLAEQTNRNP